MSAVTAIVARVPARLLMTQYKVGMFSSQDDMLQQVAHARGKLRRGGTADIEGAARIVLTDWRDGKLPFHTLPPSRGNEKHEHATVVTEYSKEFDIGAISAAEEKTVLAKLDEDTTTQAPRSVRSPLCMCFSTMLLPLLILNVDLGYAGCLSAGATDWPSSRNCQRSDGCGRCQ